MFKIPNTKYDPNNYNPAQAANQVYGSDPYTGKLLNIAMMDYMQRFGQSGGGSAKGQTTGKSSVPMAEPWKLDQIQEKTRQKELDLKIAQTQAEQQKAAFDHDIYLNKLQSSVARQNAASQLAGAGSLMPEANPQGEAMKIAALDQQLKSQLLQQQKTPDLN